jgi:hypothetical protein
MEYFIKGQNYSFRSFQIHFYKYEKDFLYNSSFEKFIQVIIIKLNVLIYMFQYTLVCPIVKENAYFWLVLLDLFKLLFYKVYRNYNKCWLIEWPSKIVNCPLN